MTPMLKAISLLLTGGAIGAFAAGGGQQAGPGSGFADPDPSAASVSAALVSTRPTSSDVAAAPRAEVTQLVHIGMHRAMAARSGGAGTDEADRLHLPSAPRVRVAQAAGRISDFEPPAPTMRPILVGARDGDAAAGEDGRGAETWLAESIQKELKRVGCYTGNIDGDWGPETRRAMRAFNDRVNASLPIDQPDYILLTLLQGHAARACGAACPPGQDLSGAGKCLPRAVLAEERRRLTSEREATASQVPRAAAAIAAEPTPERADRAEIERERIAAAEARRQQKAAEIAARAEADRRARLAAAEEARAAAEARRREEFAALAAQAARRAAAAARLNTSDRAPATTGSVATSAAAPLPVTPNPPQQQRLAASRDELKADIETATPPRQKKVRRQHQRKSRNARFAGRFVPPPIYRVGRLPAVRASAYRLFANVGRPMPPRGDSPQRIFRDLQYRMP